MVTLFLYGDSPFSAQAEAAHLCYLIGGVLPQAYEAGARMCLLGADHRAAPHTLASVAALQRTEVLDWARLPGAAALCGHLFLDCPVACVLT